MLNNYPLWIIIFDFVFGLFFWILILKFILHLFYSNETTVKVVSKFYKSSDRIYSKLNIIIPNFLPYPLISIYLCWLIFIIRFYILPMFTGPENIGYNVFFFEKFLLHYLNFNNLFNHL